MAKVKQLPEMGVLKVGAQGAYQPTQGQLNGMGWNFQLMEFPAKSS